MTIFCVHVRAVCEGVFIFTNIYMMMVNGNTCMIYRRNSFWVICLYCHCRLKEIEGVLKYGDSQLLFKFSATMIRKWSFLNIL